MTVLAFSSVLTSAGRWSRPARAELVAIASYTVALAVTVGQLQNVGLLLRQRVQLTTVLIAIVAVIAVLRDRETAHAK